MAETRIGGQDAGAVDIGDFCRRVEEHLTRVNEGQLVRLVGPSFELVRDWAIARVPLSVVFHGIDLKAERHRAGRSRRPLRLEFCEHDVRDVYAAWLRSVGLGSQTPADGNGSTPSAAAPARPSLSRHLERAADRLSRVAGRLELPDAFRDEASRILDELTALRERGKGARGEARAEITARLAWLDDQLIAIARTAIGENELDRFRMEASADLSSYRSRLAPDVWERTVTLAVDRLLRDHLGLPTLGFEA